MTIPAESCLARAREFLQAARDEFHRAEAARGGEAVIGLKKSCGNGWLAALEAINAFFLQSGVAETDLPNSDRSRRYFAGAYMKPEMRRTYSDIRVTFRIDGYYDGIVDFDEMPDRLNELEEFIEGIAGAKRQ